jgi:uncharacterized membrane protein YphA (DoxX/SURF4 family)
MRTFTASFHHIGLLVVFNTDLQTVFYTELRVKLLIPVAAQSKTSVCNLLLLGLLVRIPPGSWVSVCWQCCVFLGRRMYFGLVTRSRWVLLSVVCLSLIMKPRQWGFPGPQGPVEPWKKNLGTFFLYLRNTLRRPVSGSSNSLAILIKSGVQYKFCAVVMMLFHNIQIST